MVRLLDYYNMDEVILEPCDIISFTYINDYLDRELNIAISTLNINVKNSSKIYKYFYKIKELRPVKFLTDLNEIFEVRDFLINPVLSLPLKSENFLITLTSPLTLFNIESNKVEYKELIKKDEKTYINFNNDSIFSGISNITNSLYKETLRILKVNKEKSDLIDRYTYTFLINESENILSLVKRLCWEFSLSISWDDGIVIKDLKKLFKENPKENIKCIVQNNYNEDILIPSQNRLIISWTDKNFKSLLELLEEDLKSVYAEKGQEVDSKLEPLKPLFEGEFYPDYSDQYKNVKTIDTGFLIKKLAVDKSGKIIGILSRNVKTEINPILLIEDSLIMFNPYNEYFKLLPDSKDILSKSDFYKEYSIKDSDKIYKLLESRYKTEKEDYKLAHPTKAFLMLKAFESGEQSLSFSFQTQPRAVVDPLKKLFKDIFYIQVFASTHYRNTEYTMKPLEIINTREERKELFLYINEESFANEEYAFKQALLLNGYNIATFQAEKKLEPLKVYKLFNPLLEDYISYLIIKEEVEYLANSHVNYNYIGFKVFNFDYVNKYIVEITTSILDIARKQLPILLKTIWDTNLRFSYYTHFYIDNLPKLAIDGANNNALTLIGYYTFYVINEIPETSNLVRQAQGDRENLVLLTPKEEVKKVEEKFNKLFGFTPSVQSITGVEARKQNKDIIINGDFEGREYGGQKYFSYPYREQFTQN